MVLLFNLTLLFRHAIAATQYQWNIGFVLESKLESEFGGITLSHGCHIACRNIPVRVRSFLTQITQALAPSLASQVAMDMKITHADSNRWSIF